MLAREPLTTIPRPGNPNVVLHRTPLGEVNMWPNNRVLDLFAIQLPIIQAPMAGSVLSQMVVAVSEAGGLGSLPCALLSLQQMRKELQAIRRETRSPINGNFF